VFAKRPVAAAGAMVLVCAAVYLPMRAHFGFGTWVLLLTGPFWFQAARIGLYFVWFLVGTWIGAEDLDRGLLSRDGSLARNWRWWVVGCLLAYNSLVIVSLNRVWIAGPWRADLVAILWVVSCVASCFAFLALFRGALRHRRRWMDSLVQTAYAIYILHYIFVLWIQFGLMDQPIPAGLKFAITFAFASFIAWSVARVLLMLPGGRRIL
jgi:hypothetical protein